MCKAIAENNSVDLSRIITMCDDIAISETTDPDLKAAMQMSRGIKPTRPITRPS